MKHDKWCEEYSEACGCARREELFTVLADCFELAEDGVGAASCEVSFMEKMFADLKMLAKHPLVIEALLRRLAP